MTASKGDRDMEIPKRTKDTDISQSVIRGKAFKKFVEQTAKEVARRYVDGNEGKLLNELIAEVAKAESLNRIKIQAIVEETNTQAYLRFYEKKRNQSNRDVRFPLASLANVIEAMGDDAPPEVVNPNVVKGGEGNGQLDKKASAAPRTGLYLDMEKARGRIQKRADAESAARLAKEARQSEIEVNEGIFKVAHALVRTEQMHGNANLVFNTMLDEANLSDGAIEGIIKKASSISETLHQKGKLLEKHMVNLKVDGNEKVASHILGAYSLNQQDGEGGRVRTLPVSGFQGIDSFDDMVKVAKTIERFEEKLRQIKQD